MNDVIFHHYSNQLEHMKSILFSANNKIQKRKVVEPKESIVVYDNYVNNNKNSSSKMLNGDITVVKFLKLLYNVRNFDWFDYQLMLIPNFLNATLLTFYSKEWDNNSHVILKKYELDKIIKIVLSCAPRRDGKTTMVAAWFAILLLLMPGPLDRPYQLIVASRDKKASLKVIEDILMMLNRINYDKSKIKIKKTSDQIVTTHYDENGKETGISRVLAFSSTGVSKIIKLMFISKLILFLS